MHSGCYRVHVRFSASHFLLPFSLHIRMLDQDCLILRTFAFRLVATLPAHLYIGLCLWTSHFTTHCAAFVPFHAARRCLQERYYRTATACYIGFNYRNATSFLRLHTSATLYAAPCLPHTPPRTVYARATRCAPHRSRAYGTAFRSQDILSPFCLPYLPQDRRFGLLTPLRTSTPSASGLHTLLDLRSHT